MLLKPIAERYSRCFMLINFPLMVFTVRIGIIAEEKCQRITCVVVVSYLIEITCITLCIPCTDLFVQRLSEHVLPIFCISCRSSP